MTDRCGPAGAADLLIGENDTQLDSLYVVSYEASERVQYITAARRRAHQMQCHSSKRSGSKECFDRC